MPDAIIIGTRPEIIKCAPLIKLYERRKADLVLIHTNQHYSFNMDKLFFEQMHLREPDHNLNVGSGTHAEQTGKIMVGVENVLHEGKIDTILVQGDTNTVLGSALAASKLQVKIGHVEAGLRSFDRSMPEEVNRVLTDHVSDYLFCPTEHSRENVLAEGIPDQRIHVVGNTIVDATLQHYELARKQTAKVLQQMGVTANKFNLLTAHRPANVDDPARLNQLVEIMRVIVSETNLPIVFPIHPRTKSKLDEYHLLNTLPADVQLVDPVGYMEFLILEKNANLIFTDSGGVQEEACILRKPCITLRENTERPETVDVGANIIVNFDIPKIKAAISEFSTRKLDYQIPFGDGTTSEKIFDIIHKSRK
ncbi:MAG: non-hydrolyzing UDP-N-acetylglucosamine 2-epimerase [Candidatus Sigynarchaeota archaeon]